MDPDPSPELRAAALALAQGRVVCFPTESSYGLAARLDQPDACARIAALKERDPGAPFPVIAASLAAAQALSPRWPRQATDLAARHWPGPLTLVVVARPELPIEVIGPGGGVGVRVSSHPIARALARDGAITATSANRRGQPPACTIADARAAFAGDDLVFLDGGECSGGPPSTVVSVGADGALSVIRQGAVDIQKMV